MKDKIVRSGFVRLDSGRELDLSGTESDVYTVPECMLGVRFVRACHLALHKPCLQT